jgi:hypothetical protein
MQQKVYSIHSLSCSGKTKGNRRREKDYLTGLKGIKRGGKKAKEFCLEFTRKLLITLK